MKLILITNEQIAEVKQYLKTDFIREAARKAGVSYTTAWHISKGNYDRDQPLQNNINPNRCPITGFVLRG